MSRQYEAMVILKSAGTEAELAQAVTLIEEPIKRFGGRVEQSTSWGRRRLTYKINRQGEGLYHLLNFELAPDQLDEVKRLFRLNETIIRYLILNRAEQAQQVAVAAKAAGRKTYVGCVLRFSESLNHFRAWLPRIGSAHSAAT